MTGRRNENSPIRSKSDMNLPVTAPGALSRAKFIKAINARIAPEWKNIYR
jgi:hypothetical protein